MPELDLKKLTIKKALAQMEAGELSARVLVEKYLAEIERRNPELNAYLEVFSDALDQADEADRRRASGEKLGRLNGIPLAIKDNILIKGRIASSASKILANYRATYNATVIEKLLAEGAIFLGRTNMDEFAMGGSTENSAFGSTRNPHDSTRVPGGSSGGSAAVVGGDLALASLGTDTGGSIRQPASFCGVVGLKPTYGMVSRFGVMAMASSLDQVGPIAKNIEDAEFLFEIISGRDENDSTSLENPLDDKTIPTKWRIGVPKSFLEKGVDEAVLNNFDQSLEKLKMAGHEIVPIEMPNLPYSLACYYVLMPAEASTNLARFDGVRYGVRESGQDLLGDYLESRGKGFGREVRRRIMLGTYVLSAGYYDAYYGKAVEVRELITRDYLNAFKDVHFIATPTAPTPAFPIGEKTADPLQMYLEDIFTVPVNLAGVPAISIPSGATKDGLPLGIQLAAPHFRENWLFAIGHLIFGD